ncbi:hypothetical protein F5141DRAFT_1000156 [Pisolithus sp. B1]|nr:hypothetical protein F5141DRAFT_1000156 [Pisolithus sp. B1]
MKTTCEYYDTCELPQETAVQGHCTAAKAAKEGTLNSAASSGPKHKCLNLQTYKFHALGDYLNTICQCGTTDNYMTQPVNPPRQKHDRTLPSHHYHIAESSQMPVDIPSWLNSLAGDRAIQDFFDHLKDHLLERILGVDYTGNVPIFLDGDRDNLIISQNVMYKHQTLHVNYTIYDLHWEQDMINPHTHADIMLLSHETDNLHHPYWYAHVIRIFHVNVQYYGDNHSSDGMQQMNMLFTWGSGFAARWPYWVGFIPEDDPDTFGFLDPDLIIHGVHLIPAFSLRQTAEYLGPSFI